MLPPATANPREIDVTTTLTERLQSAKSCVIDYCHNFDSAPLAQLESTLAKFTDRSYRWRGSHPFHSLTGPQAVVEQVWKPLKTSFTSLQRRPDVFFAGVNDVQISSNDGSDRGDWVCQMGHFMGLFDHAWLDIPPTHKLAYIRFAEFHRIHEQRITETALFIDLLSVMRQAGHYPLPPATGATFMVPGPRTGDGLLYSPCAAESGAKTLALVNRMIQDLSAANQRAAESNDNAVPREVLASCWHEDMLWYGPEGIGATYTIDRYQQQHQYPFRYNLTGKTFNGHVARFAEGDYCGFFGWPNLTNQATGGFLGLPRSGTAADMRVVDIYRRDNDKLAENWVLIDLPHWLNMQGLDVLARMRQLLGIEKL
jgi:predicted ester cyclase